MRASVEAYLEYIWIDTICIDKTNSTELSEAIKLMFRWYEESKVCFAYLVDVQADATAIATPSKFSKSRWFTRGWNLQELLAPHSVLFFDSEWTFIGNRDDLAHQISAITGISQAHLLSPNDTTPRQALLQRASVAERMSWASRRETTREEDIAYCLLGIFDVNIPLLYGEGTQAFQRLQMEILTRRFDPTLLAWILLKDNGQPLMPIDSASRGPWLSVIRTLLGLQSPWYMDAFAVKKSDEASTQVGALSGIRDCSRLRLGSRLGGVRGCQCSRHILSLRPRRSWHTSLAVSMS